MKEVISGPQDQGQIVVEDLPVFSLPALREEVDTMREKQGASFERELRRRVRNGIGSYFRILANEQVSTRENGGGGGRAPQSVEEAAGAYAKKFLEALASAGANQISAENRILLFGGSGKGSGLLLQSVQKITEHLSDGNLVALVKKEIEDLAVKTLASSEDDDARGDTEGIDDLAGMIAANITGHRGQMPQDAGDHSMLSAWGSGTALTFLPTRHVVTSREAPVKANLTER